MPQLPGAPANPYTSILDEQERETEVTNVVNFPTGPGDSNPYATMLEQDDQRKKTALQAATLPTTGADPDKRAAHIALGKKAMLPVDAVEADPEAVANELRLKHMVDAVSKSPTLQAWMTMDDNAILSMDDYENLSGLEATMRTVGDVAKSPIRGLYSGMGQGIKGAGALIDAGAYSLASQFETPEEVDAYMKASRNAAWWQNPSVALKEFGDYVERGAHFGAINRALGQEDVFAPLDENRANFATDVGEGLGNLVGQAVTTYMSGGAGLALMAGQGAEQQAERAEKANASEGDRAKAAAFGAAITAASEKLGLDLLLERMPPKIRNKAVQWLVDKTMAAGIEGIEESVEQVGNNLVAQMLYDPEAPIFEGVQGSFDVGAGVGFIARSLLGLRGHGVEAQEVKGQQTSLDAMVEVAGKSALAKRAPDRFEQFAAQAAQDGAKTVYVPAESVQVLFQNMTAPQAAEALGVALDDYQEAMITGGDVAIPVETYLSRVAPQYHEQLREVARFTPGAMTPEEAAAMDEVAKGAADRFMASVQAESPSDQKVYEDVTGQMLGTGRFRREDVEKYATLMQAAFRTMAAREGKDAFELYNRYRLRIESELPAVLSRLDVDTTIDPIIERLRAGDVPRGSQRQTLADFIAAGGGVTDKALTGELATLHENDRVTRRGKPRLVRKDAIRDLDRAREAAAEAGYLPADSDVNDLLNALDAEMSGQPTYAMGDEADTPEDHTKLAVEQLDEELGRRGIDVHKATNAEIKAALFGEGDKVEVPDALVQVFDQPAYHGTHDDAARGIEEAGGFKLNKIGTGEGAQAFGWGMYFASQREVAEGYREALAGSNPADYVVDGKVVFTGKPKTPRDMAVYFKANGGRDWAKHAQGMRDQNANEDFVKKFEDESRKLERKRVERKEAPKGQVFQVEVPDDGDLLDYDKPLSGQSAKVQAAVGEKWAALNAERERNGVRKEALGAEFYGSLVEDAAARADEQGSNVPAAKTASEELLAAGIPGMKYADGVTRGKDGDKSHNYVIWDEGAVSAPTKLYQSEANDQTETEAFKKWSNGAPVVDDMNDYEGGPAVFKLYHGTTADFDAFDRDKANPESDLGAGFYFSNTPDDVATNYAGEGPDLTNKIQREAERIAGDTDREYDDPEVIAEARAKWVQNEGSTMPVFVHAKDPAIIGGEHETFLDYRQEYDEETDEYGDEEGLLIEVIDSIRDVADNFDGVDAEQVISDLMGDGVDDGMTMSQFVEKVKASEGAMYATDNETGDSATGEFIRQVLESTGFDAIVDYTVDSKFGSQRNTGKQMVGMDEDTVHVIAFSPEQIKSATGNRGTFDRNDPSILHQSNRAEEAIRRGYIKFGGDRHFNIGLLEKADATTFLHESGHFFLEVMGDLAADPNASEDIKQDYAKLLEWFGVESRDQIATEHHEQFARGFEQYLGEGKAPSPELQPAFARFKAWVKAIYRTLRALNVDLTDDVRGVFDRMLASEEEITQAEQSMDYTALFPDANSAGWTDAEFATRLKLGNEAREEAEARLTARAMKDNTRETKAWWKERSAEVRAEVEREIQVTPVYRAWSILADGTLPDGTVLVDKPVKLDKAWLEAMYGQEWLNKHLLRKRVYQVKDGLDPDVFSLSVGFQSGDEMVRALANAQPQEAVIRAETHQRMIAQYGDVLTDGSMPEEAMRAVHSDRRYKAMEADLKALERLAGDPRPSGKQMRHVANAIIGQKKVRDVQPNTYLRAERKAAKEAIQETGRQNWGLALEAQRRRLLNAHLYDVASKVQDETERLQRYIRKFEKTALRQRLGKVGRLEQVDTLMSQYDMKTISGRKIDQNKARGELLRSIENGEIIAPASLVRKLQAGNKTNWRDLTVEELRGLRDILAQTEAMARAEYKALVNGERVLLDEVADDIAASTDAGGKAVMPIYGDLSPDETVKKYGKQALASWLRPSALARLLDGGKDNGAWTRHIIQPVRRAVSEVLEPMKRKASEDLSALYQKHYTTKEMAAMNERSVVPGLQMNLSRWDLISLALNQGNAENKRAVVESEVAGKRPYSEAGVRAALETLDARDWAFVQEAWDYIDTYWPAIKAAQTRRKGIAPPKVEAEAFTVRTRDGQVIDLKGGYYPLKYNSRLDAKARQHEMDDAFERMRAGTLSAVQSKYGHQQERVGSGRQPVMLSMNVLHSHINNVIMDIALGDVVGYADRVLGKSEVRRSLIETGNLDALETWKLWLKDTATGEIGARTGIEQMAQFVRFGFTKSKVGFNAMTIVLQMTGLTQTIPVVGAGYTARAAIDFASRPRSSIKQVMAESAFMRTRYELNAFNKDIAAVQDALKGGAPVGKGAGFIGGFINAVRAVQLPPQLVSWAFYGIRQTQILVDSTTWLAGYRKATEQNMTHAQAVQYADGIVENSQTSGMFSDRSAIERGTFSETTRQSEFLKLWTTLMSYMIAKGNIAFESYKRTDFKNPVSVLSFGGEVTLLFAAEALLMGIIKGGLPDDDDPEGWFKWLAGTIGTQAISTIPIVREIPSMKYGGGNTPLGSTAKDIWTALTQTQQGEIDEALVKSYVNLVGTATGAPAAQINRAFDAFWREQAGEDVPGYEYLTGERKPAR